MQKSLTKLRRESTFWTNNCVGAFIVVFGIVLFWIVVPVALYLAFGLPSVLAYLAIQIILGIGVIIWAVLCL
jgi:hypothetical protein